jgi:phosphoribosylglycinamide formyltransferase 1
LNSLAHLKPIAVLISGRGSNMRALIEHSRDSGSAYRVAAVLSDRADAAGLRAASEHGIPAHAVTAAPEVPRADYDQALSAAIDKYSPALVVLAGFMRILSAPFVEKYAGRILNIHPSLLPKYAGLHTHRRVLEAHEAEHGATVHFVTEQLDGGPPIIQARVAVAADDTEAALAARVQVQEHQIYPLAVQWFCEGRLRCEAGHAWLDGRRLNQPVQLTEIERVAAQ